MYQDVADLNAFYHSRLGQITRRLMLARIRARWPDVTGMRVMGLGYASPFLSVFHNEAERVLAFAPAMQGVIRWPGEGRSRICLTDEDALPLPDQSVDRILLIHALEHSEARTATMARTLAHPDAFGTPRCRRCPSPGPVVEGPITRRSVTDIRSTNGRSTGS